MYCEHVHGAAIIWCSKDLKLAIQKKLFHFHKPTPSPTDLCSFFFCLKAPIEPLDVLLDEKYVDKDLPIKKENQLKSLFLPDGFPTLVLLGGTLVKQNCAVDIFRKFSF